MPTKPTYEELLQALRDARATLNAVARDIQSTIDGHDNVELAVAVLNEAQRLKLKKISISWVQRHFRVGFCRAAQLIDEMERAGTIAEKGSTTTRKIITQKK
jgi:DNA segregation ATPase FtsK/SpoIIIE-like protein